ncbi:rod shape-determining protein MreD [Nonomuraea sp. NPDC049152]|uniref:rod shape-determining protein MreD n=1 Tax=Nonomuraea sp. NPDC049152 TaxID=3154350 RepID=UPI0033E9AD15
MIAVLAVLVALLVQVTVVNRFPLPPGGGPDLVLLVVIGVALARGPSAGAAIGFSAGMLVDLMPPTAHVLGQYAFVYALVGYVAGRGLGGTVPTVMLCVLAAPLLAAAVGWLIGDPRVTAASIVAGVPVTVCYSLLAAPAVIWLVTIGRSEEYAA